MSAIYAAPNKIPFVSDAPLDISELEGIRILTKSELLALPWVQAFYHVCTLNPATAEVTVGFNNCWGFALSRDPADIREDGWFADAGFVIQSVQGGILEFVQPYMNPDTGTIQPLNIIPIRKVDFGIRKDASAPCYVAKEPQFFYDKKGEPIPSYKSDFRGYDYDSD